MSTEKKWVESILRIHNIDAKTIRTIQISQPEVKEVIFGLEGAPDAAETIMAFKEQVRELIKAINRELL